MTNLNENSDAPIIPDALTTFPGSQANLLPLSALESPLLLLIAEWPNLEPVPRESVWLTLWLNGTSVAEYEYPPPFDTVPLPLAVHVPKEYLGQEGIHEIHYTVSYGEYSGRSTSNHFTIDRTPPIFVNPGETPQFPPEVIKDGITQSYLDAHGDEVLVTIPWYERQWICDTIELHYGSPTNSTVIKATVLHSSLPTVIKLTGEIIRLHGSGKMVAFCRARDRAGNVGPYSAHKDIDVFLG